MEDVFTRIYKTKQWEGIDVSNEFSGSSGQGSDLNFNKPYIRFLKMFIKQNNIKSVVDIGCGDWRCGRAIYDGLDVTYTGYDVYEEMINSHKKNFPNYEFIHADGRDYKKADLCIIKDVIQHWTDEDIEHFLSNLRCKYTLIVNCGWLAGNGNSKITTGEWRPLPFPSHPIWKGRGKLVFAYSMKEAVLFVTG